MLKNEKKTMAVNISDDEINSKYEKGEARIVTESGSIKLALINSTFTGNNYQLKPKFQRRITWDPSKRSKLIESFIMNVPVPPVFLYETEFNYYQVMDGLQRITAIIDFYSNKYSLENLSQWRELNGKYYKDLPQKIKEGIDRRQLSVITLLKESSSSKTQEDEMKKMVFERLNTGGVSLSDQEIRNALYEGAFNDLCITLSENKTFRKLWEIEDEHSTNNIDESIVLDSKSVSMNKMYDRMEDVELVLRFFAMRHIDEYSGDLSGFLDSCLVKYNQLNSEQLNVLSDLFVKNINIAYSLFEKNAFKFYRKSYNSWSWSKPSKMIYDAMMIAIQETDDLSTTVSNPKQNKEKLREFYKIHKDNFNGKVQSKKEIRNRAELFKKFIIENCK